jgi:RNA recognition motif-containing protein
MTSLIKCRKCGGPHVTIKCGKEKQDLNIILEEKFPSKIQEHRRTATIDKRKLITVKISNLPDDITQTELNDLVSEWGKIGRVNISAYEHKSGFIDFYYKDEAEYFVKALDRTKFDYMIINVEIIQNNL